jgi:hypothetical protein
MVVTLLVLLVLVVFEDFDDGDDGDVFTQRYIPRLSALDVYVAPSLPVLVEFLQSIAE